MNTEKRQTRILAVHDISCIGKCSLTVALPILSAGGIETAILPTAILSNHTGVCFSDYTFRDLTDDMMPTVEKWENDGIDFDAVYSGYLGSSKQMDIVKRIFEIYRKKGAFIIVDPAMADNGKLYAACDESFPCGMRSLCEVADIIVPNITEAVMMLGEEFRHGPYSREYIEGLIERLKGICRGKIVLTGVHFDDEKLGAAAYDPKTDEIYYSFETKEKGMYHGTGDVFASVLLAAILNGKSLNESVDTAVKIVAHAIRNTPKNDPKRLYGVSFEASIPLLVDMMK